VLRASDLRLSGRKFNDSVVASSISSRRTISQLVLGWVAIFWAGIPSRYVTSHPSQLSLLSSVRWKVSTGQSVVMHFGWRSKAEWLIPSVDKCVGSR